jgi:hypothetical protein
MLLFTCPGFAHQGLHDGMPAPNPPQASNVLTLAAAEGTPSASAKTLRSGQGRFRFQVAFRSEQLPDSANKVLKLAHGGFAVDRRADHGETYFALPGAGILRVSSDFKRVSLLPTAEIMRKQNMHNTTIWYGMKDRAYLTFPANNGASVFTTTLQGEILNTLETPKATMQFGKARVNTYFANDGKFVPTDVSYRDDTFYVTTGYSPLDYVLTAKAKAKKRGKVTTAWAPLAFGGRGDGPGELGTGHGITLMPDGKTLAVADRPNAEIERYSAKGDYLDTVKLPKGSFPCDIDFTSGYALVGCLHGPDRTKGAPIYLLKDDEIVSTVMPKEELGLVNFQHIHNAVLIERENKLYIIAQAWNPGDFVILEQVVQ